LPIYELAPFLPREEVISESVSDRVKRYHLSEERRMMKKLAIFLVLFLVVAPIVGSMGCAGEAAPAAGFSASPTYGTAPLTVQFTDQSTGEITDWAWDFGDGETSIEQSPSHTYDTVGEYTVSLKVIGPGGSDTETKADYIDVGPVHADFTASPTTGDPPLTVQFTDQSTGEITDWAWDFGDGETSTEQSPSHTYNAVGEHTISLTITGPAGSDTETKVNYIEVGIPELTPTTWKLSHGFPETSVRGKAALYFKQLVEEYTDGKITVDVYPNNTLFDPFTAMGAVRAGTIDVTFDPPYYWGWAGVPWVGLLYTWGLIPSWEAGWSIFSNPEWTAAMTEVWEPLGVKYLGMTAESLYMCYPNNRQPVHDFQQMAGWRDAIPTGSTPTAGVTWIGFDLVYLPYEEHASAFQTGMVDTYSASISTFVGMKVWEYAKYLIAGPNVTGSLVVMNDDTFNDLPAYWQDVLTNEVMPQVMAYAYDEGRAVEESEVALLEANMEDFYIPTPEQMATMLEGELALDIVKAMMWDAGETIVNLILEWQS
jgi:PKD repeat protein